MNSVTITSSYDSLFLLVALLSRILYYFSVAAYARKIDRNNILLFVVGEGAFIVLLLSFIRVNELTDQRDILALLCGYNVLKLLLNFTHSCGFRQIISAASFVAAVVVAYMVDQETTDVAARTSSWVQILSWAAVDLS
jgi:hypothetical protein